MENMVRLREFAVQQGVSERTVQLKVKAFKAELEGHVDRRGKLGTWLDEYAQTFLKNQLMHQTVQMTPTNDVIQSLSAELMMTQKALNEAQQRIIDLTNDRTKLIEDYTKRVMLLEADNAERDWKIQDTQNALQKASEELEEAKKLVQDKEGAAEILAKRAVAAEADLEEAKEQLDKLKARNEELESRKWWQLLLPKKAKNKE